MLQRKEGMVEGGTCIQSQQTSRVDGTTYVMRPGQPLDAVRKHDSSKPTQDDPKTMCTSIHNL
jgi:hypothetical protein